MRALWVLLLVPLFAGCLQDASDKDTAVDPEGMPEIGVASATFELGMGVLPFIVELEAPVPVRADVTGGTFGAFELPGVVALLSEQAWHARGACLAVEPVFQQARGSGEAVLAAGRYVVVAAVSFGHAVLSFDDGPATDVPTTSGGSSTGSSSRHDAVAIGDEGHTHQSDGEELVYAFLDATPNGPELDVAHRVALEGDPGPCHEAADERTGQERHAGLWAWVDGEVTVTATADALPVPPNSSSGLVHMSFRHD